MIAALFIDYLTQQPAFYVMWIVAVVVSVVLHELAHGVAALWQGDDTPRAMGHMTWNPMVHMGGFSLILLFVAGIAFGMMPVNPARFRSRFGNALVAAAGPATNLVLAFLGLTALGLWLRMGPPIEGQVLGHLGEFLLLFGMLNLVLCVFNMLPVPPLDGSTVLADVSPGFRRIVRNPNNQPFFMGAFLLVFFFSGDLFAFARRLSFEYVLLITG